MTTKQLEILCTLRAGLHPLSFASGRRVGAVVRNLERLHRAGYVKFRRGSRVTYELTKRGRVITGR